MAVRQLSSRCSCQRGLALIERTPAAERAARAGNWERQETHAEMLAMTSLLPGTANCQFQEQGVAFRSFI